MSSCAFRSVMNAMDVLGGIGTTGTGVVQGTGPLGLIATAVAKISGARRVITVGAPDARLAIASGFVADETLSSSAPLPRSAPTTSDPSPMGRAEVVMEF